MNSLLFLELIRNGKTDLKLIQERKKKYGNWQLEI